ncbi:unnamed protein product [Arctia plantaginis]|uniref:Major facilitator superfamily (MFS) profile domain-containing protein n=1 Tax=Arctia plantaginis TaxID=874455 RepID=A0A8S1AHN4_ARCPL|nr:unnamed protein product [Arctia plantaginis]
MGQENPQTEHQANGTSKAGDDEDIFERILSHLGDMGLYQKLILLMMMPIGYTCAFTYFVQMFITVTPQNYWCRIPELANLSMELRKQLSAPVTATGELAHCVTFDTNWTQVLDTLTPPADHSRLIPCQHGWEYELSDIPYPTITTERDWVCERSSYVPTAQSVFFVGSVIGCFIFGWLADHFGRVPAIIVTNLFGGIFGIATTFTSSAWDFMLCRFFVGLSYDVCLKILYVLVLEYVGLKYRTLIASLSLAFSFATGGIVLPWIVLYIGDWRILMWVTSAPMFIVLLAPWFLPESVRWLISRGKVDEAVTVLHKFERINGKKIPDDTMNEFKVFAHKLKLQERRSLLDMCKSSQLRKAMIILILLFMGCGIVFDGLIRLSDSFGLNFFAVFSCNEVSECTAILLIIVILDRFGRRTSTFSTALISSICLIIALFISGGVPQAVLAIASRLFMTTCFTSILQWSTEIIPTPYRASGVSILHMSTFLVAILSPFIVYSERLWSSLPLTIFATIAVATTGLCLTLPETKGLPMPQTRADGERNIKEHCLFGHKKEKTTSPS